MKTMAYCAHGGVALLYHAAASPGDEEWAELVAFATQHVLGCEQYLSLVMTDGGAPTGKQRRRLVNATRDTDARKVAQMHTSVLTEQLIPRGVLNAFSWLGFRIKGFAQPDMEGALGYLGIDPGLAGEFREVFERLKREIGTAGTESTGDAG